jgi:hypothetical protein
MSENNNNHHADDVGTSMVAAVDDVAGTSAAASKSMHVTPLKMPLAAAGLPVAPGTPGTPGVGPMPVPVPQTPTAPVANQMSAAAFEVDLPPELLQQGKMAECI